MALRLIGDLIELYIVVLFVRIMFTWFPITPGTPAARFEQAIGKVTDPLLSPATSRSTCAGRSRGA